MSRYYIYDANGDLFGNPKGYNKYSTAQGVCTRKRHTLWAIYDARSLCVNNFVWTIKLENK